MKSQQDLPAACGRVPNVAYQHALLALCFVAKEISLSNSPLKVIVDDEDYERAFPHNWNLDAKGYPRAHINGKAFKIHRFILRLPPQRPLCDHKDRNPLNNQKDNLRICTHSQNGANQEKNTTIKSTSSFKGVCRVKGTTSWEARIRDENHDQISIGLFITEEAAARAYDFHASRIFGEFACLNFPNEMPRLPDELRATIGRPVKHKFRGVFLTKKGTWKSYYYDPSTKKVQHLAGVFATEELAARNHDKHALINVVNPKLNFPQ